MENLPVTEQLQGSVNNYRAKLNSDISKRCSHSSLRNLFLCLTLISCVKDSKEINPWLWNHLIEHNFERETATDCCLENKTGHGEEKQLCTFRCNCKSHHFMRSTLTDSSQVRANGLKGTSPLWSFLFVCELML